METIYENNEVSIKIEQVDKYECKVNVNDKNLIWISIEDVSEFKNELCSVLDKFRI